MSTNTTPEPEPADVDPHTGSLALEPHLPGPADLPATGNLPDDADTVADPAALAARLTGGGALQAASDRMIAVGTPPERVHAAVALTDTYTRAVADLLTAVDRVIADQPGAMTDLTDANARLAQLEQGRLR